MADASGKDTRRGAGPASRLAGILSEDRFDDRVDTTPGLDSGEAIAILGRSLRLIAQAKALFAAKCLLQLSLVFPALALPWLAKIVVDNAILARPVGATEVAFPPFMAPFVRLVEGRDPLGVMLVVTAIYVVMLIVFGSRAGGTSLGLLDGQDAATQAENQISAGHSGGSGVLGLGEFVVNVRLTQSLASGLRTRLFERMARLPMAVLDDQRIGDSIYRVLYDVPSAPDLIYEITLTPFFFALGALLNLYVLQYSYGQVSPELVVIAWLTVPVAFALTFPFSGALRRTSQNKRAAGAATTNAMEESFSNVAAVQSLGAGSRERERFARHSAESFRRERYSLAVVIATASLVLGAAGLAAIYVTVLVTDRIIDGAMSPGDFAVLLGVYYQLVTPAMFFGALWIKLQGGIAALRRVFFFLDHDSEEDRLGGTPILDIRRGVRFDRVCFAYPGSGGALRNVSLDLHVGELTAIVGPTGAGKTTLALLIPALLRPTSGRVLIDDLDAEQVELASLRRLVAYVFQEHLLLSESIRENLALANPDATEADMRSALDTAGCTEFVARLPDGLDTVLGRSGDTLSVGQQQRLSIARGLLRDARILVLDEPTAALDPQTENALTASLRRAAEDRLVVVIAHRLSTIRHADRIVFLEDGEVREVGTHEELTAMPEGRYRDFMALQSA